MKIREMETQFNFFKYSPMKYYLKPHSFKKLFYYSFEEWNNSTFSMQRMNPRSEILKIDLQSCKLILPYL